MNNRYFNLAKKQAIKSNHHTFNIGAVIVIKHKVISFGHNILRTHPKSNKKYQSIHAEFAAINNVGYGVDLSNAHMYVYRENAKGPAMSRPCLDCMELIKQSGIKTINYTIDNGYAQEDI